MWDIISYFYTNVIVKPNGKYPYRYMSVLYIYTEWSTSKWAEALNNKVIATADTTVTWPPQGAESIVGMI